MALGHCICTLSSHNVLPSDLHTLASLLSFILSDAISSEMPSPMVLCVKMNGNVLLTVSYITAHGVLQARILEWVAISFSSGSCYIRTLRHVSSVLAGSAQHDS